MTDQPLVAQLRELVRTNRGRGLSVEAALDLIVAHLSKLEQRVAELESLHSDHQHVDALWYLDARVESLESDRHNHGEG